MKKLIRSIPIPLAGVILSLAALGNLLQSYSENLRLACGIIAFVLLIPLLLKIIVFPKAIKEDLQNPILESVAGTFTMSLMLLSVYVKPLIGIASQYIWFFAIILHCILIIYFTIKFIFKFNFTKVFASYYIVYVGIAVAGITAPAFKMQIIGKISFIFGFATLLVLLPVITYRHLKIKSIAEPAKPLFCIFTAPASLCLAAYIQSFTTKNITLVYFLLILSLGIYVITLVKLPSYLKLKFYPSYAAFTFPYVISAIATKQTMALLKNLHSPLSILKYVVLFQTIIAVILVVYTLVRFLLSILGSCTSKETVAK